MTLGDRIAVMRAGVLQQVGSPARALRAPDQPVRGRLHRLAVDELPARRDRRRQAASCRSATVPLPGRAAPARSRRPERAPRRDRRPAAGALRGRRRWSATQRAGITFTAKIDVLESMGSEFYAYFVVESERVSSQRARGAGPGRRRRRPAAIARGQPGRRPARRREPGQAGPGDRAVVRPRPPAPVRPRDRPEPAGRRRRGGADAAAVQSPAPAAAGPGRRLAASARCRSALHRNAGRRRAARLPARPPAGDAGSARRPAAGEPDDVELILPYEEVIEALGFVSERRVGLQVVPLDAIVGTVDRARDFDRRFRPTSGRVRSRWEQIAAAMRRGEAMPPVDLLRIGEIYFVRDGHHRVSVARALGRTDIDAYRHRGDHARRRRAGDHATPTCRSRATSGCSSSGCRCPTDARAEIELSDPWDYARAGRGRRGVGLPRDARSAARRSTGRDRRSCGSRPSTGRWWRCSARPS